MLANSGLEAKAVRLSTASISGPVAALHFSLFSWLKAPSSACTGDTTYYTGCIDPSVGQNCLLSETVTEFHKNSSRPAAQQHMDQIQVMWNNGSWTRTNELTNETAGQM